MLKRKDNLSDVVERLSKVEVAESTPDPKVPETVVVGDEIVQLGQKPRAYNIQAFLLELSPTKIQEIVTHAFENAIENARTRLRNRE